MPTDRIITEFDRALKALRQFEGGLDKNTNKGDDCSREMSANEVAESGALMRVNHTGEVCAQALYSGQLISARDPCIQDLLFQVVEEEASHLEMTGNRLSELGERTSRLDPFFYTGAFLLGFVAGSFGNKWSLGFVAETEKQVAEHLDDYINRLPNVDQKSRSILKEMKEDEIRHGDQAVRYGGSELPEPVKNFMSFSALLMKKISYRL